MFRPMTKWHERAVRLMREKGWTQAQLAREAGVNAEALRKQLKGDVASPRGDTLTSIARALDVTPEWLMFGVNTAAGTGNLGGFVGLRSVPLLEVDMLMALERNDDPRARWPAGGKTITVPDDVGERAFAWRVDDDSMGDRFRPGDVVVFDPDEPPRPSRYVLVRLHNPDRIVFRRFRATSAADPAQFELAAENPDYPKIAVASEADGWVIARGVKRIQDI